MATSFQSQKSALVYALAALHPDYTNKARRGPMDCKDNRPIGKEVNL